MSNTQVRQEVDGVQGSVLRQGLGDNQECLGILSNGVLLVALEAPGVIVEVQADGSLYSATTWDDGVGLKRAGHSAQGVVHRAIRLLEHELVGAAEQDGGRPVARAALHEDEIVVADALPRPAPR